MRQYIVRTPHVVLKWFGRENHGDSFAYDEAEHDQEW